MSSQRTHFKGRVASGRAREKHACGQHGIEVQTRRDYEVRAGSGKSWKRSRGPNAVQNGRRQVL